MPFTLDQLLLRDDKKAQLIKALQNTGEPQPLERCIAEAAADVARLTTGFVIGSASLDGWTRIIALWKAYTIAGTGVPKDIQTAHEDVMKELRAIAGGELPNTPRADETPAPGKGSWGSATRLT